MAWSSPPARVRLASGAEGASSCFKDAYGHPRPFATGNCRCLRVAFISLGATFIVDIPTRRAMVLRPPPSRLVAVCVLVTFLLALLLRHLSMSSPWSTATSLAASSNPMRNYLSLPAGSEGIDTASEIGRASNRSLGVRCAPASTSLVIDWRSYVLMRCV